MKSLYSLGYSQWYPFWIDYTKWGEDSSPMHSKFGWFSNYPDIVISKSKRYKMYSVYIPTKQYNYNGYYRNCDWKTHNFTAIYSYEYQVEERAVNVFEWFKRKWIRMSHISLHIW